ncbi:type II toxin-antitoxin system RelE/ParE family toxin [Croceicoccus naphthovorans]|uniref:Plasmid stabilization protein n=1 Tax=Croceicoccus naphthovorans TaxID=1348774 RepID=A0A0G3XE02_9SPHN|nr:type II toxin-antitoxin system RelE/ParE family toxin [Croceicoccus naphthovorans]AKM09427.1 plasmid stabilization protein [Croceicoccus naphthovorans]MBB3992247.1 toxin ParE1/3/4 [Croceicoccus naphthovorans]
MKSKPVVPRQLARDDVEQAVNHYLTEGGQDIALDFVDALEKAFQQIADNPASDSPRWGHDLNLPGLRSSRLQRFSWIVFYLEWDNHIDVWRVLHAQRDIPSWMQDSDET